MPLRRRRQAPPRRSTWRGAESKDCYQLYTAASLCLTRRQPSPPDWFRNRGFFARVAAVEDAASIQAEPPEVEAGQHWLLTAIAYQQPAELEQPIVMLSGALGSCH